MIEGSHLPNLIALRWRGVICGLRNGKVGEHEGFLEAKLIFIRFIIEVGIARHFTLKYY